jgi:hypothetical protein
MKAQMLDLKTRTLDEGNLYLKSTRPVNKFLAGDERTPGLKFHICKRRSALIQNTNHKRSSEQSRSYFWRTAMAEISILALFTKAAA